MNSTRQVISIIQEKITYELLIKEEIVIKKAMLKLFNNHQIEITNSINQRHNIKKEKELIKKKKLLKYRNKKSIRIKKP